MAGRQCAGPSRPGPAAQAGQADALRSCVSLAPIVPNNERGAAPLFALPLLSGTGTDCV